MIFHALLACSLMTILVSGQRWSKAIQSFQPRIGYSTNIVHTKPGSNDLNAESSINVNFPFLREKAQPVKYTQVYTGNNNAPSAHNTNDKSNFFKVGYNLKFNDNNFNAKPKDNAQKNSNKKFENAEVITGRQKKNEKVRAPVLNTDLAPKDFVSNAYLRHFQLSESAKYNVPPIIHKLSSSKHFRPPKTVSYSNQEESKPEYKPVEFGPVQDQQGTYDGRFYHKYTSTNYVEPTKTVSYTHSTQEASKQNYNPLEASPVQLQQQNIFDENKNQKYTSAVNYQTFNHDVALKNSESFDFSNAHGDINIGDNTPASSEQYSHTIKNYEKSSSDRAVSDINNIKLEEHIPKSFKGVKPLPLDTSLLKDPVLTTDLKNVQKDNYGRMIPIHFDVRPIQTAMQNEISKLHQNYYQQNPYSIQQQPQNTLMHEDNDGLSSNSFRTYGKPEPIDTSQYRPGWKSNYEEDIYKIVSMRPPPIAQNMRY